MTLCLEMPTLTDSRLDTQALLDLGAHCVQVARGNKMPLGFAWQDRGTTSLPVIDGWLTDGYNVGLLLGHGNLIDVEYDDAAGRQLLQDRGLLDIETPTWSSGRGEHRLFRLAGELPQIGWRKIGGAEFRIGGKPAQSVLPPSIHPNGTSYAWTISPLQCEPAVVTLSDLGI
jgi:hypothetical protein